MKEKEIRKWGLRLIEEIAVNQIQKEPSPYNDIYRIAHTINEKNCRKNHPEWISEIERFKIQVEAQNEK